MLKMLFPHVIYHHSDENPNVRYALLNTLNVMITSISEYDYFIISILGDKDFIVFYNYYSTVRMMY